MDQPSNDRDGAALATWLAEHDEVCPVCGYALRGVSSSECPECGSELRLGVRTPRAIAGPWLLALIGFALALGFDAVTCVLMGAPLVITAGEDPGIIFAWITLLSLGIGSAGGVHWLITRRRWWATMAPSRQWKVAWGVFLGVGIVHALVGAFILLALSI